MNLRQQVFRGGAHLAIRQGMGMVIGLIGSVLVLRTIGPKAYGLFAGTFSISGYISFLSQWGINIYLIRHETEPSDEDFHQAFSLLLLLGIIGCLAGLALLPLVIQWLKISAVTPLAVALFAALPLQLTNLVPMARLERALDYRRVALVELCGQLAYYVLALPLAFWGAGPWTLVGGFWMQLFVCSGMLYRMTGYRPCWFFDYHRAIIMARYGLGFSGATWLWQLRVLVNPLIVGRYLGAEAMGYVALASRIVELLSFVKAATWRLSISALAKVQSDPVRLAKAVGDGMRLQVMGLGPLLAIFAWCAPWVLSWIYGQQWLAVMKLYSFIALGSLTNAGFTMHASALAIQRQNWRLTCIAGVLTAVIYGAAFVLVKKLGLTGYGWAEIAALPCYYLYHLATRKHFHRLSYVKFAIWWAGCGLALFVHQLGWWCSLGLVALLLWNETWREIGQMWQAVRK